MKWFKHQADAHTNLKIKELMRKHKLNGYAFYFLILEFLAKNSEKFRIKHEKLWKKELKEISKLSQKKTDEILLTLTELDLISKNSFKKGILSVPKMKDYADEYTRKVKTSSRQTPDKVAPEQNRTEQKKNKNRIDKSVLLNKFKMP